MSKESTLDRLAQKQREIDLFLTLDEIRDTTPEPSAMLSSIVNFLADEFKVDACLLALVHRDTGDLDLKAISDRADNLRDIGPEVIRQIAEKTFDLDGIRACPAPEALNLASITDIPPAMEQTQFAIVPINMSRQEHLGVLMMLRSGTPFSEAEIKLLEIVESQLDSAVIQGYLYYELQLRNKELETIYRIDRIRDKHLPFDEMLTKILNELRAVIQAEMGFIMLYHRPDDKLELRAFSHDDLFHTRQYYDTIQCIAREALQKAQLVFYNHHSGDLDSMMCIPLILREEILGVFGVVNRYSTHGFDEGDRRLLAAIASQMDTAIFEGLEKRRLRQVLGRSVDPTVMERLLANPDMDLLKGERAILSVLYADIRGSTALAEHTPPDLLVGFINDYLGTMADVVLSNEGTLDKFVGDEVMAFFGAPHADPDHAIRAIRVGLLMQEAHQHVMSSWEARGVLPAPIGVGIATGELIVGEMGSAQRTNYTVIGRAANLGSRICGRAKAGEVLISQNTYDIAKKQIEAVPISGLQIKGVSGRVTVYRVIRTLD
ncbi:MAG: GAF domain-containing protein [Anaerolineae bacterium]|nr:GAF domain-containing protein [Anaerolineae bacterium]